MKRFAPLLCLTATVCCAVAEEKPLPPPAARAVDFARDIQPILQDSCLRCHGPLKTKSRFRLDNRASALAGGAKNTNDIVPGDSAGSMLIRYVSYTVEDMEMPPVDKGDQLTPAQVGLLRAWIDQGANWGGAASNVTAVVVTPTAGAFFVQGNASKFRELEGETSHVSGGLEKFSLTEPLGSNEVFTMDGHLLVPDEDFKLSLGLDKTDLGFVHAGFEQWRRYYASDGGFDSAVTPSQFLPPSDLYLNEGHAWVDFGLELPNWPQMVLGYEYQYRQGSEASLDWGIVNNKNIYPATQGIDEHTHIVKFDVTNDFSGWLFADSARLEFYSEKDSDAETGILSGSIPNDFINTRDDYHHVQGMNTVTFEKPLRDWWLLTGGFYYSRLEGYDYFNQTTALPTFGINSVLNSQQITLSQQSEIFSVASTFTPLNSLTVSLGSQNEWTHEDGFGASVPDIELDLNTPASSSFDEFKATQQTDIRWTKIPFTVVSGGAQISEETVSEYQEEDPTEFTRDTAADNLHYNAQFGFVTSPWRAWEFSAQFRRDDSRTDYNQLLDVYNAVPSPSNGYPAFILNRKIRSDLFAGKIVWRPATWLKTTLTYQLTSTRYTSITDPAFNLGLAEEVSPGGPIVDGTYNQETYGLAMTVTPIRRLYLSGAVTYGFAHAFTADNNDPSLSPYRGDTWTLTTAATYALDAQTSLQLGYSFSDADYAANNAAIGVPLGLNYTRHDLTASLGRKFTKRLSASLRYAFSQYSDPGSNGAYNYTAHGIFGFVTYKLN